MAPPMSMTIPELAEQEGITATTLYNWRKQARARGQVLPSRSTQPDLWTSQEKFQIVLETAPMNEAELSAYCRERGLYPEQVEAWRDACMNANDDAAAQAKQLRQARKAEQKRLRKLERELERVFYNTLRYGWKYQDPGVDYFEERYRQRLVSNLHRRAKSLGYELAPVQALEQRVS